MSILIYRKSIKEGAFMLKKRVAVVTGGTRGIGKGISKKLAQEGNIVVAVYRSNRKTAMETKAELQKYDKDCDVIQGNVCNQKDIDSIMEFIREKYGRVDILVNNAGIFDFNFIEDMTEEYLDNILSINFKSPFLMIKAVLPFMKTQKYGRIVSASSISSSFADCGLVGYGASKACVNMLTKIASAELGPYGITVNAYAPGITHTDMTDEMITERGDEQVKQISLNRFGSCEEVAALVAFLASDNCSYITGEIIGVDGGMLKVQNPYRAYEHANGLD